MEVSDSVASNFHDTTIKERMGKRMGRRITILGMGESGRERRHDILRYCEGTEIWGLNNGYAFYPSLREHWARFFELHSWPYLRTWDAGPGIKCHFSELHMLECPVYVTVELPVIARQVIYDPLKICRHHGTNFFLGTPSLMVMLMLYEHDNGRPVEHVQSYGIDTQDGRHAQQRVSWAYWLHEITNRGITVGGTMADFMLEKENDAGLEGLRAFVGREMKEDAEVEVSQTAKPEAPPKTKPKAKRKKKKGGRK